MSTRMKIVYIDDEAINVQLFQIIFKVRYEVVTGSSGAEGLDLLDNHPDAQVVISDMRMPGMSGLEFIAQAKQKYPDKKYYLLTGFEISSEIQAAIESGLILNCFQKPFNLKEIEDCINK
ncbi:MAG: response regulator [Bacteroidales bacterium]|nr:response regulator [Bacteroidales bacterium]